MVATRFAPDKQDAAGGVGGLARVAFADSCLHLLPVQERAAALRRGPGGDGDGRARFMAR
jgi:hypothetical protein